MQTRALNLKLLIDSLVLLINRKTKTKLHALVSIRGYSHGKHVFAGLYLIFARSHESAS